MGRETQMVVETSVRHRAAREWHRNLVTAKGPGYLGWSFNAPALDVNHRWARPTLALPCGQLQASDHPDATKYARTE